MPRSPHSPELLPVLPTFIVIGAMKSGTTSLYYYLDEHPEIGMSAQKETDFFVAENNYERGLSWYKSLFDTSARARGEASPNYTKRHIFSGVPERMKRILPNIKLVYLVRDPIERLVSHYVGSCASGYENRTLPETLTSLETNVYVQTSRYFWQLEPYLAHYDAKDLLVVTSRELGQNSEATMQSIYRFLGVDATFANTRTRQFNTSSAMKRRGWLYRTASSMVSQSLKDRLRPHMPVHLLSGTPVPRPSLTEAQRDRLAAYFAEDLRALRTLTSHHFNDWHL